MTKSEFKKYIDSLISKRDKEYDKGNKTKASNINATIRFLNTATSNLKDNDDFDVEHFKKLLVFKKTNHAILAEGYLDMDNEDLMENELEEIETMEEVESYLDSLLK